MIGLNESSHRQRPPAVATTEPGVSPPRRKVEAFHQSNPTRISPIPAPAEFTALCEFLRLRIKWLRRNHECGAVLLIDHQRAVYLVPESNRSVNQFIATNPAWLVGTYAKAPANGSRAKCPATDQLAEDIAQHFTDLGIPT